VETDFLEDENGDAGEDGSGKNSILVNSFLKLKRWFGFLFFKANHLFIVYTNDKKSFGF